MKRTIGIVVTMMISQGAISQIIPVLRGPSVSGGFQVAVPRGEFAESYRGMPYGINAALSVPVLGLPLEAGGGFAWNRVASESGDVNIPDATGAAQPGELSVLGNAYTYYVHGRLRPFNGQFRPYAELLAGMRTYSVKSSLDMHLDAEPSEPSTSVSDRDFTWVSGFAVGLQYRIVSSVFVEARFEKLQGDRAQYINPQSLSIGADGSIDYQLTESRTDQLNFSLGLAFGF